MLDGPLDGGSCSVIVIAQRDLESPRHTWPASVISTINRIHAVNLALAEHNLPPLTEEEVAQRFGG